MSSIYKDNREYGKSKTKITNIASMGINYVRPPDLNFEKKRDTRDYTEYEITTNMRSKNKDPLETPFTDAIDSFIFCNKKMNIKMPKPSYMINEKTGEKRFAYVVMMFPNPKNGKATYLDGCILAALGLRRQKTLADIICVVIPDINTEDRGKLNLVFDKVMIL